MSDYCALTDAYAYIPKLTIDANSKPTSTQAALILANVTAEVSAALNTGGYEAPPTDADTLEFLKGLAAKGVAGYIEAACLPEKVGDTHSKDLVADYKAQLNLMREGKLSALDVTQSADIGPYSNTIDPDDTNYEAEFTKGMKF